MNDRFKFRFFDKKKQKMMYENSDFSDYCKDEWWGPEEQMALEALEVFDNPEHYILMQSTGLKDKNGKLIFEGDVIKYYFDDDSEDFIVKYSEKDLAFITETFDGKYQNNFIDYDIIPTKEYEIIGNIFENKELLNEI